MRIPLLEDILNFGGRAWWAPLMIKEIGEFVPKGGSVLDIGAGGGWIGKRLSDSRGAKVTLLDVADMNRTSLPLKVYDGKNIPFPDASFDTSLLLFVLHHCEDSLQVLAEAVRVSKKRLVIFEDTFRNPFEKFLCGLNDWISNSPFFLANPFKMNMPFHYRQVAEWEDIFRKLSLKVAFKKETKHFITRHTLFILEKCTNK
ncbi:MAG: class I SAM-dependent methyltransferase [Candidatus Wildermuthbacteria bacterium]|nr:class I SAM-dependent methyltransferase [Candidatus Wildermuthbacteria bacterium]